MKGKNVLGKTRAAGGMPAIELKDITPQYAKAYGFCKAQLVINGKPTHKVIVLKDGQFIETQGVRYKILPHEMVIEVADSVAKRMGLKPFEDAVAHGMQLKTADFAPHALLGRNGWHMFAFYTWGEIGVNDRDKMHYGLMVQNSIDGAFRFGAGFMSFRGLCENMVYARKIALTEKESQNLLSHSERAIPDMQVLEDAIGRAAEYGKKIIVGYKRLMQKQINTQIARKLASAVPKKDLPDYIYNKEKRKIRLTKKPSLWVTYNDITEKIWHSNNELLTKEEKYEKLHKVLAPIAGW